MSLSEKEIRKLEVKRLTGLIDQLEKEYVQSIKDECFCDGGNKLMRLKRAKKELVHAQYMLKSKGNVTDEEATRLLEAENKGTDGTDGMGDG